MLTISHFSKTYKGGRRAVEDVYKRQVETSVRETLAQGIHGWEVTDAAITLTAGEHHPIHTHPLDFFVATPVAFLRALTACGSRLLEPLVQVLSLIHI